ncbi:unnamed protein product [Auanema sp. JU1783]|nr:unnamed protein product [Auanema sp. JU1783]
MSGYYKGDTFPDIPSAYKDSFPDQILSSSYAPYSNNETETAVRHIQNELYHVSNEKLYISRSPCSTSGYSEGAFSSSSSRYCSVGESPFHTFDNSTKNVTQYRDNIYLETYYTHNAPSQRGMAEQSYMRSTNDASSCYTLDSKNIWIDSPASESDDSERNEFAPIPPAYRDMSNRLSMDLFEDNEHQGNLNVYEECCSTSSSVSGVAYKKARIDFQQKNFEGVLEIPSDLSPIHASSVSESDEKYILSQATTSFEEANIIFDYNDDVVCAAEFAEDVYDVLYLSEKESRLSQDFLSAQREVSEEYRTNLILSYINASEKLSMTKETLHLACFLLDKCLDVLCLQRHVARDIAAVVLVLASKVEEYNPYKFSSVIKAGLTSATAKMLEKCEKRILFELRFRLNYPNPYIFANYFHSILRSTQDEVLLTNYILELCLLRSCYREWGGPHTAHAAIILSHVLSEKDGNPLNFVLYHCEKVLEPRSYIPPKLTRPLMADMLTEINLAQQNGINNMIWKSYSLKNVVPVYVPRSLLKFLEG